MPLTSKLMDQQGNVCVYQHTLVIDIVTSLYVTDYFMPVVVTVRNASSTHKISAACLLSDA